MQQSEIDARRELLAKQIQCAVLQQQFQNVLLEMRYMHAQVIKAKDELSEAKTAERVALLVSHERTILNDLREDVIVNLRQLNERIAAHGN